MGSKLLSPVSKNLVVKHYKKCIETSDTHVFGDNAAQLTVISHDNVIQRVCSLQDGVVHASLEPAQILYLTIAYDWFLFG